MSISQAESVSKILSIQLNHQPSALEFLPLSPNHFIVGTYSLDSTETLEAQAKSDKGQTKSDDDEPAASGAEKSPQSRSGALLLFHIGADERKL